MFQNKASSVSLFSGQIYEQNDSLQLIFLFLYRFKQNWNLHKRNTTFYRNHIWLK